MIRSRAPLLFACGIVAAVSIPLILRLIGPNSIYGFRTPFTQSSPEIWYPANVFAGWALLIAATVSALALSLLPRSFVSRSWIPTFIFLAPIVLAVLSSFMYLGRLR